MSSNRRFPLRRVGAGLAAGAVGWSLLSGPGDVLPGLGLLAGGLATVGWPLRGYLPRLGGDSRGLAARWQRRSRRNAGTASWWDVWHTSSAWAMRRKATVLRPSLRGESAWQRLRAPVLSYAVPLAKVGRQMVWTSCEESTLRIGIPGTGKTAELACRLVDAPGGCVVTSTATDLYELTAPLRAIRGPVQVFNPGGIGGVASTLRWSPLSGCTDPATAARRAGDLMGPPGPAGSEGERWAAQGRRSLAVLLHAAALGGYRMRDVAAWVATPEAGQHQVLAALLESPAALEMSRAAQQLFAMNSRTRDGVMLAVAPALAWTTQPAAVEVGDPQPEDALFTVAELTDFAGTLYLLGDDDGAMAPLVGALVAEIAHQARATAANRPGGRLDPGLTMCLDEIALVCPTPLDRWMAELRKRSIVIHAACQGLGQLRERWGDNGASMILNSAAAVLVFGGCKDAKDLAQFAALAGERDEDTPTLDEHGRVTSTSTRRVPVIEPAMLAGLPNFRAMLIRRGMPVALARTPIAWKRRDIRRASAKARTAARTTRKATAGSTRQRAEQTAHA